MYLNFAGKREKTKQNTLKGKESWEGNLLGQLLIYIINVS